MWLSRAIATLAGTLAGRTAAQEREDIGRALSPEEETALLRAAAANRSPFIDRSILLALTSVMRAGEIRTQQVGRVNFA